METVETLFFRKSSRRKNYAAVVAWQHPVSLCGHSSRVSFLFYPSSNQI